MQPRGPRGQTAELTHITAAPRSCCLNRRALGISSVPLLPAPPRPTQAVTACPASLPTQTGSARSRILLVLRILLSNFSQNTSSSYRERNKESRETGPSDSSCHSWHRTKRWHAVPAALAPATPGASGGRALPHPKCSPPEPQRPRHLHLSAACLRQSKEGWGRCWVQSPALPGSQPSCASHRPGSLRCVSKPRQATLAHPCREVETVPAQRPPKGSDPAGGLRKQARSHFLAATRKRPHPDTLRDTQGQGAFSLTEQASPRGEPSRVWYRTGAKWLGITGPFLPQGPLL